jgi:hypothetical protein
MGEHGNVDESPVRPSKCIRCGCGARARISRPVTVRAYHCAETTALPVRSPNTNPGGSVSAARNARRDADCARADRAQGDETRPTQPIYPTRNTADESVTK